MRSILLSALLLLLCGCGPGLEFHSTRSPQEMLDRASLIFVGVIENQEIERWLFFRFHRPSDDPATAKNWKILRRDIRVETILRGVESRKKIDIYEIYWTGGATGNWNSTRNGERNLFLVRIENGRYHVVQDWDRSIFRVTSGPHSRLPLDESHSLWERIVLMNWWFEGNGDNAEITMYPGFSHNDPGGALDLWRRVKLERGLVRHPRQDLRVAACRGLLSLGGWGQDECWDVLSDEDRSHLLDGGYRCCTAAEIADGRRHIRESKASQLWQRSAYQDERRLLTTVNDRKLRTELCRLYAREYPADQDNGCPADQPPPATIVTERGDVPLTGPWPR